MRFDGGPADRSRASAPTSPLAAASAPPSPLAASAPPSPLAASAPPSPAAPGRRTGRLPLAAVAPDSELIQLNGQRLHTPASRPEPPAAISAVSYRAELRPSSRELLSHLFRPHASVVSRTRITGGRSVEEYEAAGGEDAARSLESAVAAAASLLGHPVRERGAGARIEAIREDTTGVACGDVVLAVDGRQVRTASELRIALAGQSAVRLDMRPAAGGSAVLRLARHEDGAWGIRVATAERVLEHPLSARFALPEDLRGPSLGLACALSVVDAYTGGVVSAGGAVVATGVVEMTGRVLGVGAVELKARAVRAHPEVRRFLVPADSDSDVEDARRVLAGRAEVVAVTTLSQAVEVLCGPSWQSRKPAHRSADRWAGSAMQ